MQSPTSFHILYQVVLYQAVSVLCLIGIHIITPTAAIANHIKMRPCQPIGVINNGNTAADAAADI